MSLQINYYVFFLILFKLTYCYYIEDNKNSKNFTDFYSLDNNVNELDNFGFKNIYPPFVILSNVKNVKQRKLYILILTI